ncbi:hypothetical protein HDU99_004651 [Rhizoclosmatium hyalinum]|nr:hypothetical protein HDU99_004651 [Rhizoclosmatium hyalinum]
MSDHTYSRGLLLRVATIALSLLIFIITISRLSHYFLGWKPIKYCGTSAFAIEAPPHHHPDPFFRTHLPFIDTQLCVITQTFSEVDNRQIFGGIMALLFPVAAFVALESSRSSTRGPSSSFGLLATLWQMLGISVILPLLWLPSFAWSQTAVLATDPKNFSKVSLGSTAILHRQAFGVLLWTVISLLLDWAPKIYYNELILLFQYVPTVVIVLWAPFALSETARHRSTTIPEAQKSSGRANEIYGLFGLLSVVIYSYYVLVPFASMTVSELCQFLLSLPAEHEKLMDWFLIGEWASVTISLSVLVVSESLALGQNGILALVLFLAFGVVIGHGTSFMVFAIWRERKIMETMRNALKGKKRA